MSSAANATATTGSSADSQAAAIAAMLASLPPLGRMALVSIWIETLLFGMPALVCTFLRHLCSRASRCQVCRTSYRTGVLADMIYSVLWSSLVHCMYYFSNQSEQLSRGEPSSLA